MGLRDDRHNKNSNTLNQKKKRKLLFLVIDT